MATSQINFTKSALDKITPPRKPEDKKGGVFDTYKDAKEKGLVLLVSHGGAKTFYLYRKVNGKPERIRLGGYPEMSIENARRAAIENKKLIVVDGKNPNVERKRLRADITFGEMFEQFMERYSRKEKRSWRYDEREVNKFLPHWLKRKAASINKQEVQELHERIGCESGKTQANRLLERIRAIYNKNIEWGWDGVNPTQGVKKFRELSRDRFIQANELPCFFEALAEEENATARDYIWLSLLTGARKGNVLSMRWNEVNFDTGVWRIPETKNGEPLSLPLSEQAIRILRERKRERDGVFVFSGKGKAGHLAGPKKPWKRVCQRGTIKLWQKDEVLGRVIEDAMKGLTEGYTVQKQFDAIVAHAKQKKVELPVGLMDIRIHDLRRTMGSWQAATGAAIAVIGKSLGHKSQQATAIYERLNLDPVRSAVHNA